MKAIRSERELINFLHRIREQAEPAAAPPPAPDATAGAAPAPPAAPTDVPQEPITVEDIIVKLNIVRSGRSTKDSDVKRELEEYIGQFNEDEKQALVAFLEGLGQILTSGVDSDDAVDPQDPYSLQIQKSAGATAGKALKPPQSGAAATPAPTPGPVPIQVGG
jgi:hypothetical protein